MNHQTQVTPSKKQHAERLRPVVPPQKRREGSAAEVLSPGRLCLFGEHSDWASEYALHTGYCIVVGTDQSIRATAEPSEVFCVETVVPDDEGRPSGRTWTWR